MAAPQSSASATPRPAPWFNYDQFIERTGSLGLVNIIEERLVGIRATLGIPENAFPTPAAGAHVLPFADLMRNIVRQHTISYGVWLRYARTRDWRNERNPDDIQYPQMPWREYCKWIGPFVYQAQNHPDEFIQDRTGTRVNQPDDNTLEGVADPDPYTDDSYFNQAMGIAGALEVSRTLPPLPIS